jgi:two-component system sensor kinase FixL
VLPLIPKSPGWGHNGGSINPKRPLMPNQATRRLGWRDALLLFLAYLALDRASHIHPLHGFDFTPWSPAPALGLLFLLRYGGMAAVPLALAILVADAWVRDLPLSWQLGSILAIQLAVGYWAIAEALRSRWNSKRLFADQRCLFNWVTITVIGTLLNSLIFIAGLTWGRFLPPAAATEAFAHYWLADLVGILVSMPLLAMLMDGRGRARLRRLWFGRESLSVVATAAVVALPFLAGEMTEFKYFSILFLPIAWAAARQGLAGAVLTVGLTLVGVIVATWLLDLPALTLIELQVLVVVLALSGFFIGVVVDEKQRLSTELQQTLRLAAAGEMAGALSHELQQPLTALLAYAKACQQLLVQGESGERLHEVIGRVASESQRAADIVSRLRDFFRTGTTRLERIWLRELLSSVISRFAAQAKQQGIELMLHPAPPCALWADRLQLEVVLRNLLANALEAVAGRPEAERQVRVSAHQESAGRVCITVEDSGAGVSEEMVDHLFEAFSSSKASGMGLGLAISRAIIEAHGGSLWAEVGDRGVFKVVLPLEGSPGDGT